MQQREAARGRRDSHFLLVCVGCPVELESRDEICRVPRCMFVPITSHKSTQRAREGGVVVVRCVFDTILRYCVLMRGSTKGPADRPSLVRGVKGQARLARAGMWADGRSILVPCTITTTTTYLTTTAAAAPYPSPQSQHTHLTRRVSIWPRRARHHVTAQDHMCATVS